MPGMKRKHAPDAGDAVPSKRPSHEPETNSTKPQKRKTFGGGPHGKKHKSKDDESNGKKFAVSAPKSRARDLRRQLSRAEDMPANIRIDKERELAALEHELTIARGEQIKQKMIPKYHMVRFFERQKATRILKRAEKKLRENDDPKKQQELEREKHVADVDLQYTLYYPLIRPYVSLFSTKKDAEGDSKGVTRLGGDTAMWELVEECVQNGTLDALRNGLEYQEGVSLPLKGSGADLNPKITEVSKKNDQKKPAKEAKPSNGSDENMDEDSDGGFFE